MSNEPPEQAKPRWTFVSIALFVLGLLILVPAGLCAVVVAAEEASDPDVLVLILAFSGIPIAAGIALVYAALKVRPRGYADAVQGAGRWTAASIALFVLGLLILLPSGLCTAIFGAASLIEGLGTADLGALLAVLLTGGIPAAIGAALVYAAFKIRGRA
jgi:hypothetical protein